MLDLMPPQLGEIKLDHLKICINKVGHAEIGMEHLVCIIYSQLP